MSSQCSAIRGGHGPGIYSSSHGVNSLAADSRKKREGKKKREREREKKILNGQEGSTVETERGRGTERDRECC